MELVKEGTINTKDCKVVFLICGYQFGMEYHAAAEAAKAAKEQGQLAIAFAVKPLLKEGKEAMEVADAGIKELRIAADVLFVLSADKLVKQLDNKRSTTELMDDMDKVIRQYMAGIIAPVSQNGVLNLDFEDFEIVLKGKGVGYIGTASANGEDCCLNAVKMAANNPICEEKLADADNVLLSISGDCNFSEVTEAANYVQDLVKEDAVIIFGYQEKPEPEQTVTVTIVGTVNEN